MWMLAFLQKKNLHKRKEFIRLIEDVKQDKIDIIIFTKLDRWFRNVSDYYKTQEILDAHHVSWLTALEKYENETSNGKFIVNIILAISEDEAQRTSERIKSVFDWKLQNKEAIATPPTGLKIENKHLVIDPETSLYILDVFAHYEKYNSKSATARYISEKYNKNLRHVHITRILNNKLYKGYYRGISDFCPALIDPERFDRIQLQVKQNVKENHKKNFYIFSGLIKCKECGKKMSGLCVEAKNKNYLLYRCSYRLNYNTKCNNNISINEEVIENYLLSCIKLKIEEHVVDYEVKKKAAQEHNNIKKMIESIKRKIKKLRELYLEDLIEEEEYKKEYLMYKENLENLESQLLPVDEDTSTYLSYLKSILSLDLEVVYTTLTRQQKREFWQKIIRNLIINKERNIEIFF